MRARYILILMRKDLKLSIKNINVKEVRDVLEGQDKKEFLKGAEIAYETIITSFAKGDKKKLEDLLTKQMSSNFYKPSKKEIG